MKKNGGQSTKVIAPIAVSESSLEEFEETQVPLWPMLPMPGTGRPSKQKSYSNRSGSHSSCLPQIPVTPITNKFDALGSDDDDDDEESLVRTLNAMTSNVRRASDKIQSQRDRKNRPQALDTASLEEIARKIKTGEIQLPDVDLETDQEYEYVWALVDSGAGANVARRDHFPNFRPVEAPKISLTIANGDVMRNQGAGEVTSFSRDGTKSTRVFYEAPVEMPILSVAELSKEGDFGSEVRFRVKDGIICDNLTGRQVHFVKRKGVYFMRLYFPKSKPVFAGPDA